VNTQLHRRWAFLTVAAIVVAAPAVALASDPAPPEIKQVGRTAIVYKGPQIDLALSYHFPAGNPGGQWLLLDTSMTASRDPVEVRRDAIAVRTPGGEVVPLATQQAFAADYSTLAPTIARANVGREPLNYLLPLRYSFIPFFSRPGRHIVFSSIWLDDWHTAFGRLYFKLPGTVTKGNYELLIDVAGGQVAIPFTV
jgi:hypothetical protein